MKIAVINGPNMNMLGIRRPDIYGTQTYEDLCRMTLQHAMTLGAQCEFFQSNHEGDIVDYIQKLYNAADGILINAAGYTHTSVAIADAIEAVGLPAVEVHLSEPLSRESFRKISYLTPVCIGRVAGKGADGYLEAIDILVNYIHERHI